MSYLGKNTAILNQHEPVRSSHSLTLKSKVKSSCVYNCLYTGIAMMLPSFAVWCWLFFQHPPLGTAFDYSAGALFLFSMLWSAFSLRPYLVARQAMNQPRYLFLDSEHLTYYLAGRINKINRQDIESVLYYERHLQFGIRIKLKKGSYNFPFFDSQAMKSLDDALKNSTCC